MSSDIEFKITVLQSSPSAFSVTAQLIRSTRRLFNETVSDLIDQEARMYIDYTNH